MTSDLTLLLRAIISDPADDTARLAYADCVQEAGDDERAEFIRVQVELANLKPPSECEGAFCDGSLVVCPKCREWKGVYKRQRQLFDAELGYRLRDVHDFMRHTVEPGTYHGRTDNCCLYSRGFVSHLTTTAELFLAHADALIWHPSQTMKCTTRGCEDGRVLDRDGHVTNWTWEKCDACDGSGRVPRPFPETAQPVTDVTLTTDPYNYDWWNNGSKLDRGTDGIMHDLWPGVRFHISQSVIDPYNPVTVAPPVYGELVPLLRVEPEPRECAIPSDGWFISADRQDREIESGGRMYSIVGETRYTLTIRFTPEENTFPPTLGTTLRDLTATDRLGTRYRVPSAILTEMYHHAGRNWSFDVELTAIASSMPEAF